MVPKHSGKGALGPMKASNTHMNKKEKSPGLVLDGGMGFESQVNILRGLAAAALALLHRRRVHLGWE